MQARAPNISPIADVLRRQSDMGLLGMASGDPVLSPLGSALRGESMDKVKMYQKAIVDKQKADAEARKQASDEAFRAAQIKQMEDRRLYGTRYLDILEDQKLNVEDKNQLRVGDRRDIQDEVGTLREMASMEKRLLDNPEALGQGVWPLGSLNRAVAERAGKFASDDQIFAQKWWSDWDKVYNLPERNKAFGATLTPHEVAAWDGANIGPNMDPRQIEAGFKTIMGIIRNRTELMYQGYTADNYDVETLFDPVKPYFIGDGDGDGDGDGMPNGPDVLKPPSVDGFYRGADGEWYAE